MIVESIHDIIKVSGDLTENQWEVIRTAAALLLKRHPQGVVVDCSDLQEVTPAGAETFYDMMRHIESQKARIIVTNVPPHVREVLSHVPEVRSRLAIASSIEEARKSLELLDLIENKKSAPSQATGILILSLSGGPADSYAISVAGAIAEMRQLKIVVVYPIVVPQSLPSDTPMPEVESQASKSLQQASSWLHNKGIEVELHVERTRSLSSAVGKCAQETDERCAVIALPASDDMAEEPARTAEEILSKLDTEVILVREPKKK